MPNLQDELGALGATRRQLETIATRMAEKIAEVPTTGTYVSDVQLALIETERAGIAAAAEGLVATLKTASEHVANQPRASASP